MKNEAENLDNKQGNGVLPCVSGSFDCYLCGGTFIRKGKPCIHYDEDEMDEEGEVSLCDGCAEKAMNKAKEEKTQGLSRRFFNCG